MCIDDAGIHVRVPPLYEARDQPEGGAGGKFYWQFKANHPISINFIHLAYFDMDDARTL